MKLPRRPRPKAIIPLASTADVAFLLLIFFIVLARDANESAVQWNPATATITLAPNDQSTVSVIVDKDHNVFIDGHPVARAAVGSIIAQMLDGRTPGHRRVLIKIDKNVPEQIFGPIMLDIGDAGGELFRVLETPTTN